MSGKRWKTRGVLTKRVRYLILLLTLVDVYLIIFNEERQKLQVVQQDTRASLEGVLMAEQMNKLDQKMRENAKNEAKKK